MAEERPCRICGEDTYNEDMCRDCDIENLMAKWPRCPCGWRIYNPKIVPVQPHSETCPHEETGAYDPEDPDQPMEPIQAAYASGFRAGVASVCSSGSRSDV